MAVVAVGYFAVAQYVSVAHGQSSLLVADQISGTASADGAQVLSLLSTLSRINLDGKIFSNPDFLTLQDWSVDIAPQEIGRSNPYLPVYGSAPVTSSGASVSLPKKTGI